jgi:chemotaxis protein MotB
VQSLISGKRIAALQVQIDASERQLRVLNSEIQTGRAELSGSLDRLGQQQAVIADNQRQFDTLRSQLQDIAVLRVTVLNKLKQAVEAQLGTTNTAGTALVSIGDNGNIVINENLVFEYAIRAVRANIDTIVIQGHTDERGSAALNWDLSAKRATAVLDCLFDANKALSDSYARYFSASGYSKFRPIDPGTTEAAYQQNRRIEISVVPKDDNVRKIIDDYAHLR